MSRVLVPLAEGFEELEAVTIVDLLRRAGIEVVTAGLRPGPVTAARRTVIVPDTDLDQVLGEAFDMIVLPGGLPGADHLDADPRVRDLVRRMADSGRYTAAICAAPKVLASAGVLENKRATSYPGFLDRIQIPGMEYLQKPVVKDGKVITSRGPGTAMDFALELIEVLEGPARRMEVEEALIRPAC
ncbi:MAG TPA: DJ-1/PfpI family protein [Thiotrichales bacterium]|nr:DJ-1/PfpI family protein [Thiotrichales bacterium]